MIICIMYPLGNIWAAGRLRTESRQNYLSLNSNLTRPITPVTYLITMYRSNYTAVHLQ